MKKIALLLIATYILSSCGQTGPLYLPTQPDPNANALTQQKAIQDSQDGTPVSSSDTNKDNKTDKDPSLPKRAQDQTTSGLINTGDGFGFNQIIQNSSGAGGLPS